MKPELTLHLEFSILLTLWRQYCCLSDWLSVQLFALMHSSQVTFAFHTVCFCTVHAILISILINAQKKCRGNCWLVKANRPWRHNEFAVPWDLLWHLIPQLYRHLRQQLHCLALMGSVPVWLVSRVHTVQHPRPHHITTFRGCWRKSVKHLWGWR